MIRTVILGFVIALTLLPANANAGVLMTDSFAPQQGDAFDITAFINTWFNLDNSERLSPGVLMGD